MFLRCATLCRLRCLNYVCYGLSWIPKCDIVSAIKPLQDANPTFLVFPILMNSIRMNLNTLFLQTRLCKTPVLPSPTSLTFFFKTSFSNGDPPHFIRFRKVLMKPRKGQKLWHRWTFKLVFLIGEAKKNCDCIPGHVLSKERLDNWKNRFNSISQLPQSSNFKEGEEFQVGSIFFNFIKEIVGFL